MAACTVCAGFAAESGQWVGDLFAIMANVTELQQNHGVRTIRPIFASNSA